jgi:5-methylcytosine-specific restriction endonuclease McrA
MRLRASQLCPLHNSRYCCGRKERPAKPRRHPICGPVTRIPDEHNPRGYIEVCSPAEMRRRLIIKLKEQKGICALCGLPIEEFSDASLDHIEPQPAGCKKDSHPSNLQATHRLCNLEKGSKRTGVARN